jgi:pre-mRNA-splicing factor CWC26
MTSKADYLKRYESGGGGDPAPDEDARKKKRRKKKDKTDGEVKVKQVGAGVRILDEDVDDWKRADDSATANPEEGPVVVDAKVVEGERVTRARPYLGIREDGSGWAVAEDPRNVEISEAADDDLSPPRARRRHDSDDEEDVAMKKGALRSYVGEGEGVDLSPPRARRRHDSDDEGEDLSPPRARRRHDSDDEGEDLSPPRARERHDSDDEGEDLSPPRARERHDDDDDEGDLSPPRRTRRPSPGGAAAGNANDDAFSRKKRSDDPATRAPADFHETSTRRRGVMTDGTSAGLVDASVVVREADEKREAAKARVAAMSAETSGRDARTLFRDKATGALIDAEELARRRELANARSERARPVWAGGVAQEREARERNEALEEEAKAPFARGDIDARADAAMRAASRFGDPMAHLARKRLTASLDDIASPRDVVAGVDADALRKSGFRVPRDVPAHSWKRRGVGAPPNRFSIEPGRHWDGVDRGTGFEQEMFKALNDRSAKRQADWKYGQSMWE